MNVVVDNVPMNSMTPPPFSSPKNDLESVDTSNIPSGIVNLIHNISTGKGGCPQLLFDDAIDVFPKAAIDTLKLLSVLYFNCCRQDKHLNFVNEAIR